MSSRRDLILGLVAGSLLSEATFAAALKRSYLLGSTLIEDIVKDLVGEEIDSRLLIAGSACPGHTDVKAADLIFAIHADGIFVHPPQAKQAVIAQMITAHKELETKIRSVNVSSSWLIPGVQKKASKTIANLMIEGADSSFSRAVKKRLVARFDRIDALHEELRKLCESLKGKSVIAAAMQGDFCRWCGLNVVGTFGSADTIDPRTLVNLVNIGRKEKISGVVENLQSGQDAGRSIAEELRVKRVVLSNFPQTDENTPDYFTLARENTQKLVALVKG